MKINFKQGLRRIILSIIALGIVLTLFVFISSGCIFDSSKYVENSEVLNIKNNKTMPMLDFANTYLKEEKAHNFWAYDFSCVPYKRYCLFNNDKFYNNKVYEFEIYNLKLYSNEALLNLKNNGEFAKAEIRFIFPPLYKYILWQILDLIKIFFIAGLIYGIYLLFEQVICWIIKGFKQ